MDEEKYIREQVGNRNPFVVPEGYFDAFAEQMLSSLPERKPKAKSIWLRPVYYAAAAVCALFVSVAVWKAIPEEDQQPVAQATELQADPYDAAFEDAAEYMMLDNHDMYAYMSEEY